MNSIFFYFILLIFVIRIHYCFSQLDVDPAPESEESALSCGVPENEPIVQMKDVPQTRIINGDEARAHSWPWQISLQRKNSANKFVHICGGSLVSPNKVISAAHCLLYSQDPEDYIVVMGVHNLNKREPTRRIYNVLNFTMPKENDVKKLNFIYDLLIITLVKEVEYDASVSPICISQEKTVPMDIPCYTTGWGKNISQDSDTYSTTLQQLAIPIINHTTCEQLLGTEVFRYKRMICSGYLEGGKDTCQGDSGGPLACLNNDNWYLYGVVSQGYGCATKNKPGIYTRVSYFYRWLLSQL